MDLILGGVYQGKLAYAKERFGLTEAEIACCCEDREPDWSKRCLYGFERYLKGCASRGAAPEMRLRQDAVVICADIFCGLVPVDALERSWRELAGRTITALAAEAKTVTRIFCGLPQSLKNDETAVSR